ncbi:MAG: radical SAM protein [Ruminococcaceae bacterium]|nr:radical SAM protein [Oscillospiraceae bacterium]
MVENKHKTIPIFVPHWGCPGSCIFCDQKRITGQREEMTPERAAAIIKDALQYRRPGEHWEIGFFGGSFTGIPIQQQEALLKVAQEAVQAGKVEGIRLSTRPDYINSEVLTRLMRFGVSTVELGAQSMDDEVLLTCQRGHTAYQTVCAAQMIQECGLNLGLQMMVGLPGDTPEITMKTAQAFAEMHPACVRIYPTLVIRGTGLSNLYRAGSYTPLTLEKAVEQCSRLYRFFTENKIEVIRMGLLQMNAKDVLAGPCHPAFGEMVLSAACYEQLAEKMRNFLGKQVRIHVNPRYVSVLHGQKKVNIKRLISYFQLHGIQIVQDPNLTWGEFEILEL